MEVITLAQYIHDVIDGYTGILAAAVPITGFIGICNIGINLLYSAFIGKRLHFGGD